MTHTPATPDTIYLALHSFADSGGVPEWVHLAPAGEMRTRDGRGPYTSLHSDQVIANSFAHQTKLPIDENHAIDKAGKSGFASPARGWIVAMEARPDGIWGRVDWNESGRALVADRAYRGISPALTIDAQNRVTSIQRASLVNTPNLKGLVTLHNEGNDDMNFMAKLAAALGLPDTATEDDLMAAITKMKGGMDLQSSLAQTLSLQAEAAGADIVTAVKALKSGETTLALQTQIDAVGVALGLPAGAKPADIVTEAKAISLKGEGAVSLQSQLTALETQLKDMATSAARSASEAYVDAELQRGRQINAARREDYVALHMENPTRTVALIESMPILSLNSVMPSDLPPGTTLSLNSEQADVLKRMGISEAAFKKTVEQERG